MEAEKVREAVDMNALKADLAAKKAVKLIVDNAVAVEEKPAKKAPKKAAKTEEAAAPEAEAEKPVEE